MKPGLKIFIIILLFIGLLAVTAPASLIQEVIPEEQTALSVSGFQGKLTNGQADIVRINGIPITNVQWNLNVFSSMVGTPSAAIQVSDPGINIESDIAFNHIQQWSLESLKGEVQLGQLAQFIPAFNTIKPTGRVVLNDITVILAETGYQEALGNAQWRDARLAINNQPLELETVHAQFALEGNDLVIIFKNSTQLDVNGTIKLTPENLFELTLNLEPTALPESMQWIGRMGKSNDQGGVTFSMSGKLE